VPKHLRAAVLAQIWLPTTRSIPIEILQLVSKVTKPARDINESDPIEEKAPKIVVPLVQKSDEPDEKQECFRGENHKGGISDSLVATLLVCGGLSRLKDG
jgi:hypothetical protein